MTIPADLTPNSLAPLLDAAADLNLSDPDGARMDLLRVDRQSPGSSRRHVGEE